MVLGKKCGYFQLGNLAPREGQKMQCHLLLYVMFGSSEGSGEDVCICRLIRGFTGHHLLDKYINSIPC